MTTSAFIMVSAIIWTALSIAAVCIAVWATKKARIEEKECLDDLRRVTEQSTDEEQLSLAVEEAEQARRKKLVMYTFLFHQILFLLVGMMSVAVPSVPVTPNVTGLFLAKHIGSITALVLGQVLIVWGQVLLAVNIRRRHYLHSKWGKRDRTGRKRRK